MDFAAIGFARHANHQPLGFHPSHQLYSAVMADLQAFRKVADADLVPCGHTLHRQQQLVLLRFDADFRSSVFAEGQETPYLIAKLGQGSVVGRQQAALVAQN
jgi:hypothetical protein